MNESLSKGQMNHYQEDEWVMALIFLFQSNIIFFVQNWEAVKIEEETEEGKKVESIINIPTQVGKVYIQAKWPIRPELILVL